MIAFVGRVVLVTVALFLVSSIAALVVGLRPPTPVPGSSPISLGAIVVSHALIALTLVSIGYRATLRGWRLTAMLFIVAFGIGTAQGMIEAWVFGVVPFAEVALLSAYASIGTLAACAVTAFLFRSPRPAHAETVRLRGMPSIAELGAIALLYTVAYFVAGTLAYPFFGGFYEHIGLPSTLLVVSLQFLLRGPLFGLLLALLVQTTYGSRLSRALIAGVTIAILGGVAPLIAPNPYFPDSVRWAHLVETSTSNFVFGMLAAWLLGRRSATTPIGHHGGETVTVGHEMNGGVSA